MNHYFAYGGCLRSPLEFPELSPVGNREPDWTLRVAQGAPAESTLRLRGERDVIPGWTMRLWEGRGTLRVEFGAAGSYDLLHDGRDIVWYPGEDAPLALVRSVVLGPVIALSLSALGLVCLHGSAVSLDGSAIAFLAPKFHGKSTLALMLAAAGARLVSDDMVAVHPGPPVMVRPGVHSIRLLPDAVQRLQGRIQGEVIEGLKPTLTRLPDPLLEWESRPFEAVYLLDPTLSNGGTAARRSRVPPAEAVAAIAACTKLPDPLVGLRTASVALQRIAAIVRGVPVYRLETVRDVGRMEEVTRQLLAWHRSQAEASSSGRSPPSA